jgi:hypothetical protein
VQLYGDKCLVVATSAQSAFACGGSTYHSVFFTPINGWRRELELQDELLEKMQATCRGKMYLIIEEAGMLSLEDFGYLSLRLSQARARPGSSAGNWSIILIGDFGQQPPVSKPGNATHYILCLLVPEKMTVSVQLFEWRVLHFSVRSRE